MKALTARLAEGRILAPTLGTWLPACSVGDLMSGGMCLGRIRRAGKAIAVCTPQGHQGRVTRIETAFSLVEYGAVLVEFGGVDVAQEKNTVSDDGLPENTIALQAPMSGTLYHQASPGAPAFAPEGAEVDAQATLALVEVMKSLTPVRNAQRGRIVRWLVADGEAVQAGQPLLWIEVLPQ